jgi:hypothetical protein
MEQKTAATTGKLRDWAHQAKCRISCRITDDEEMDTVEGQTPSETKTGAGSRGGAGNVETPGSPWSAKATVCERERESEKAKLWMIVIRLDLLAT